MYYYAAHMQRVTWPDCPTTPHHILLMVPEGPEADQP